MKKNYFIFLFSLFFFKISLSQNNCPIDTITISRNNLGLFGGEFLDLQFNNKNNRLFAGLETPASLFYTDDTGNTWHKAFPYDSLLYNCDSSGWGGGALKVLSNNKGWVASLTRYSTLSSSQISFSNGDSGTFKTAMDYSLLSSYGFTNVGSVTNFTLTDYAMFVLLGPYIVTIDTGTFNPLTDVLDIRNQITSLGTDVHVLSIAASNSVNNEPYYIAIDTNSFADNYADVVYKYDGISYTQVSIPSFISGSISEVFTLPQQITADTLFITGYQSGSTNPKIYRSYDAGVTWSDITSPFNAPLRKIIYSPAWPIPTKSVLISDGISFTLGNDWEQAFNVMYDIYPLAIYPTDTLGIVTSFKMGLLIDTLGIFNGHPFSPTNNYLEAIQIKKIARSKNKGVFYVATNAGLAYTTAYLNENVAPIDKWKAPYGKFPVDTNHLSYETTSFTAVDINQNDSLHVIAGCKDGFFISQNGYATFQLIQPYFFKQNGSTVNDIKIIDQNYAIALTDEFIWRTINGGLNWDSILPSHYKDGNAIAVSYGAIDTVIYIVSGDVSPDTGYIWKSIDFGASWQEINTGPNSFSFSNMPMQAIEVKNNTDTLFILAGNRNKGGTGNQSSLVISPDGGQNYSNLLDFNNATAYSLALNKNNHDTLYVGAGSNVFVYDYKNDSALRVFHGLPNEPMLDIAYGSIIVGTTTGFYSIDLQPFEDISNAIDQVIYLSDFISIYPNPLQNVTYVNIKENLHTKVSIKIYNVFGEEVMKQDVIKQNNNEMLIPIYTHNMANGIYFCTIELNNTTYFSKLIVQK